MFVVHELDSAIPPGKICGYDSSSVDATEAGKMLGRVYRHRVTGADGKEYDRLLMLVKNGDNAAALPGICYKFSTTNGEYGRVVGDVSGDAALGWPCDYLYPSTGVPVGDFFYIVVGGYGKITTPTGTDSRNAMTAGDKIQCAASGRANAADATCLASENYTILGTALTSNLDSGGDTLVPVWVTRSFL